jgi:hypothetical protein
MALPANAPINLNSASVSSGQIDLVWTDTADNEDGFKLERSTSGGAFGLHAVLGANRTTFSDTSLTPDTLYTYRVRAFNPAGDSGFAELSVSTWPLPP